ncbi:MAG: hypothetical protein GXP53_02425 [Deltaproteobacteria bacterium]|nr:hypothetical protein [Deltaproteobacteria bacterium]
MLDVKVNILKNRLYITLGRIPKNRVNGAHLTIEKALINLAPGFTCITRVVDIRDVDEKDIAEIMKVQGLLEEHGMAMAARVGAEHGKEILTFTGKSVGYAAFTAKTIDEAERLLDEWESEQKGEAAGQVQA